MDNEIRAELDRAEMMREFLDVQLAGNYHSDLRRELFARFLWTAKSHHEAILLLTREDGVVGSAFALWRPLVEVCYRGLFVGFLATDQQVARITEGCEPYPRPFITLAADLDEALNSGNRFCGYAQEVWSALNGFTHGGLEQLSNRMGQDGVVGDHFDSDAILDLVRSATFLFADTSIFFLDFMDHHDAAEMVISKKDEVYSAARKIHSA